MAQYIQIGFSVVIYREVACQYANNTIGLLLGLLNSCIKACDDHTSAALGHVLKIAVYFFLAKNVGTALKSLYVSNCSGL